MSAFELRYSHNIIEHLGIKLYQNKPTNVIAELISNSWDADASNVWIDLNEDVVTVADDGHGMSSTILRDNYLVIAKPKRSPKTLDARSPGKRKFMGRKGIGKLAPFGIAKKISLITVCKNNEGISKICWFVMDLEKMLDESRNQTDIETPVSYRPQTIYDNTRLSEIRTSDNSKIKFFLDKIQATGSGTLILMEKLSLRKLISMDMLHKSVGRRFTVTLMEKDFSVFINNKKMDEASALPEFEYRIPEKSGMTAKTIDVGGHERKIQYNEYKKTASVKDRKEIADRIAVNDRLSKITSVERDSIADMVCDLGPQVKKDEKLQNKITEQLASAMTHHPTRQLIKDIWDGIDNEMNDNIKFANRLEKLNEYLIPESLSLSVATTQRIYAINKLYHLKINGKETQLQKLLEAFPWILSPDMAKLTANQKLKITIKDGLKAGLIPAYGEIKKNIERDEDLRPDFIFFSNADEKTIKIVELKSPQIDLINEHRAQLVAYIDYMEMHYVDAEVMGILIGRNPKNQFKANDERVTVMTWEHLFTSSRKEYLEFLAAMLHGTDEYHNDQRIHDVMDFGGPETKELLRKIAQVNPDLRQLMDDVDRETR